MRDTHDSIVAMNEALAREVERRRNGRMHKPSQLRLGMLAGERAPVR